jgi:hypothetical protein
MDYCYGLRGIKTEQMIAKTLDKRGK